MSSQLVLCQRDGPVAIVTLNRPEKHNAINRELSAALASAMQELDSDDSLLAIVLTGAGDAAFCAGADMGERVAALDGRPPVSAQPGGPQADGITAVDQVTKPVIAAINGYAYGGGARLALAADIRLASTTAKFRFVGASYGLVVGAARLPLLVGPALAKELIFTAAVIDAGEAERIGLVNHLYPPQSLMDASLAMAHQIAANSAQAVRWSKKVIDTSTVIEAAPRLEAEANRELRASSDHSSRFREAANRIVGNQRD